MPVKSLIVTDRAHWHKSGGLGARVKLKLP